MKVIIDRFEGDYAVVELPDMKYVNMPKELLPKNAKEGDVIAIALDNNATSDRSKSINKLVEDVWG